MYVAVTRAKQELTVTFPLRYHVHRFSHSDRHHFAQLSRFLQPIRHHFEIHSPGTTAADDDGAVDLTTVGVAEEVDTLLQGLWK